MNILFYVKGKGDAHLAHALALYLLREWSNARFFAVVYRDSGEGHYLRKMAGDLFGDFISESMMYREAEEQNFVVSEVELKRLDAMYGAPTLWQYITHDRWLSMTRKGYLFEYGTTRSRQELLCHIQTRFLMTEAFIDRVKPNLIIYAGVDVGPSSALILYHIAHARNIPVLVPMHTRVASYMTISDTVYSQLTAIESAYQIIQKQEFAESHTRQQGREMLQLFRSGRLKPSYMYRIIKDTEQKDAPPLPEIVSRNESSSGFKNALNRLRANWGRPTSSDPLYTPFWKRRYDNVVMQARQFSIKRSKNFQLPEPGERYIYYPLHVEPELSLLLYAPYWTNQYPVVQNIAQSLPQGVCLYVKEHPALLGSRPLSYYDRMSKIPNVRLISPFVDSHKMIRQSEGIVTITGTVGLEAILMGKPVITFGDVYYNFFDKGVWHTHSYESLPEIVKCFEEFTPDEDAIINFLTAVLDNSVAVDWRSLIIGLLQVPANQAEENPTFVRYASFLKRRAEVVMGDIAR